MLRQHFSRYCILVITIIALAGCRPRAEPFMAIFALDTVCMILLYDQARPEVYENIFTRIHEIESRMSLFRPDSDIYRINAAAGIAPVEVQGDVFSVIERAIHHAELSGGAFDPTIGPLSSLWGIGRGFQRVPEEDEIIAALQLVNWRDIELNREQSTVFLRQPGMALDLGSIAKGYAADEAAEIIRRARLRRGLVDLGGNVVTHGVKQDRTPWRVGLQNPLGGRGTFIGVISGWDMTVVTSGATERYFINDDVRYHHILSPFSGHPARTGFLSATIVSDTSAGNSSMDADALSTSIFVLGYERGRALVESLDGIEAIFVFEDRTVRATGGVDFVLTDGSFRLLAD